MDKLGCEEVWEEQLRCIHLHVYITPKAAMTWLYSGGHTDILASTDVNNFFMKFLFAIKNLNHS